MSLTKSGIAWNQIIALHNMLHMERFAVKPLTLLLIGAHDVLLDNAHNLLESMVDSSDQHNWKPNRSQHTTLRRSVEEVIWFWIKSKLKGNVLDWIQMEREGSKDG